MISKIEWVAGGILGLYESAKAQTDRMTAAELNDLKHACHECSNHERWTVRTAAEMMRVAAENTIEERKAK